MKENNQKQKRTVNIRALKKGSLSIVLTVIFIAAVVLFNVIVGVLAEAYPIKIDLTSNKDYTIDMDEEYENFIKGIKADVNIVVCAPESSFTDDNYAAQLAMSLGLTDYANGMLGDLTKKYAFQTGVFLDSFEMMNKNISVSYRDTQSISSFRDVTEKFPDESFEYGDILVYSEHAMENDQTYTRYQVLKMVDLFDVTPNEEYQAYYSMGALQGPYYNELSSSKLAGEITSALYIVTSAESVKSVIIGEHNNTVDTTALQSLLRKNNFSFNTIEDFVAQDIPDDVEFVIIPGPAIDYNENEIKKLESFLEKGDKHLVYLPTTSQPELPRLEEFLSEWGIDVQKSFVIDSENGLIYAQNGETEYTERFEGSDIKYYPCYYTRLIKINDKTDATVETILNSGEKSLSFPIGIKQEDVNFDTAEKGPFPMTALSTKLNEAGTAESKVLVVSGDEFFSNTDPYFGGALGVLSNPSYANASFTVGLFNSLADKDDTHQVSIEPKTIVELSFAEKIAQNPNYVTIVKVVFMGVIPLSLVAFAIVVFVVRKRK